MLVMIMIHTNTLALEKHLAQLDYSLMITQRAVNHAHLIVKAVILISGVILVLKASNYKKLERIG